MGFMTKNKNYDKIYIESSENMGSKKNKKNRSIWVSILILLFAVIYTLYENEINETLAKFEYGDTDYVSDNVNGNLVVSFLDVGEADSIFINCDDNNMIIDGGNNADGDLIVNFLNDMGVSKIKYVLYGQAGVQGPRASGIPDAAAIQRCHQRCAVIRKRRKGAMPRSSSIGVPAFCKANGGYGAEPYPPLFHCVCRCV